MATKTFLELVNEAMSEAKVTLDPLTSANFDDPPRTLLYNKFKTWVNRAYKELFTTRNEWHFRQERAVVEVWPRLHLAGLSAIPLVGDVYKGASSEVEFTVIAVHSHEDVENDPALEYTVSVELADGYVLSDFVLREEIDQLLPVPASDVGYVKGIGTYDFKELVPELSKPDMFSMMVWESPDNLTNPSDGSIATVRPLYFVEWPKWQTEYALYGWSTGMPEFVTQSPQGHLDFYPHLDHNYFVSLDFARSATLMSAWDDMPEAIPEEYEDYLIWKAVADFADYDSNTRLFARANKYVEKYMYWLERDEMPMVTIGRNRFYTTRNT